MKRRGIHRKKEMLVDHFLLYIFLFLYLIFHKQKKRYVKKNPTRMRGGKEKGLRISTEFNNWRKRIARERRDDVKIARNR